MSDSWDEDFSTLMASVDPALIVVTAAADGVRAGCVVGFSSESSMSPHHFCLWLSKANHTYRVALRARHLGVHFLTRDQHDLAERFGGDTGEEVDKFGGLELDEAPDGVDVPLLAGCPNRIVVERLTLLDDGGDHVCLSTRVLAAESAGSFAPLRVSHASDFEPGHENDERALRRAQVAEAAPEA